MDEKLREHRSRAELDAWARRVANSAPRPQPPRERRWPSPVMVGATVFLFRHLRRHL